MNNAQRAMQVWSVLVLAARNQQILSYTTLEDLTGVPRYGLAPVLGAVAEFCKREKLPQITALVVNEPTGLPGHLYPENPEPIEIIKTQARIFVFDWLKRPAPSEDDLAKT